MSAREVGRRVAAAVYCRVRYRSLFRHRVYGDPGRLSIHRTAVVNDATFNLSSGTVRVDAWALFGHHVTVLTGTHDIHAFGRARHRSVPRHGRDVVIEEGAWVTTNATIVGPCTVGAHSVVAVGAVVTEDVPPYTVVGGVPARVLKKISPPG